jgi:lipopolysaccharide/colanic/teichoic acid biosynthesis glycosyltransferase
VDLIFVALLCALTLPLLTVLVLLIRRDGGPALFRQVRIGEGGRPFVILKLRTMRVQDDDQARWTSEHDPRVTRIGRVLRATHFDELPQLVNVVRGEMNIVGPRPEQPALVDRLEALVPYYQRRHLVKPGVAGWAQARCGYGGSEDGSLRKVCHDLYYLRHRSIRFDLAILAETFFAMLRHDADVAIVSQQAERFLRPGLHPLEAPDLVAEAGARDA